MRQLQQIYYIRVLKKTILIFFTVLFITVQALAQTSTYHVQVINQNNMVSPGEIIQLLKDSKGFLWLLTRTRVQRYDGKEFLSFSFDERCTGIAEDNEGKIWMAGRQNIYCYKNNHLGFEKIATGRTDSTEYLDFCSGPGKKIYLLTKNKILYWNEGAKQFKVLPLPPFQGSMGGFPFLKSAGNFLFFQKNDSVLARYNTVTLLQDEIKVTKGNFLFPVNEDTVWIRQSIGGSVLVSFKAKTTRTVSGKQFDDRFNDNRFFVTGCTKDFSFVSFNDKGYFSYNTRQNRFAKIKLLYNGLPLPGSPPINTFYREDNGTVWFANEEGLVYFNPSVHTIGLLRSNGIAGENWNNNVRKITEDKRGNIWFATANGFSRIDKINGSVKTWLPKFESDNYLNYSSVQSVGYSNGKIIVTQSEKGCWIFSPETGLFKRPLYENDSAKKEFEGGFNNNMTALRNGNFLIFSQKLWLLNKNGFKILQVKCKGFNARARTAYEDTQGRLWLVGSNGIYCCDSNFNILYAEVNKELNGWANAIVEVDKNTFWVASKTLFEIKPAGGSRLTIIPALPELRDVHISSLYKDSLNHIWMFADNGIYRYAPETKLLEKFEQTDNARQYYISVSNNYRAGNGILYAGSSNGINYFIPEKISSQQAALKVLVTNVTVNEDDSSWQLSGKLPLLSYTQNSFSFDYIAPHIYSPGKVIYKCMLQGADRNWVTTGSTSMHYTSLKPGKYSFIVRASLNDKDFFESQPVLFTIAPPFWQTWWFIMLAAMLITGSVLYYINRRERSVKEKEAQKTEIQKLKADSYQHQLEMEQVVNYFASSINEQQTADEMLWDVAKNCISRLGFEDCVIYLKDENRDVLIQKAAWGPKTTDENKIINPIEIPIGKGVVGTVAQTGKAEIIGNTMDDERYIMDDTYRFSEISVPIIADGKIIGVIDSEHPQKNFYTQRHLQILSTVASLCVEKIDKIKAEQETRKKEFEVLKLNKNLATSQLTALRAQMNPHFIFNALNSVQQYILQGNVDEANKYLSKFSRLQREILNNSDQQFITLEKEKEMLELYLQLEQLRFNDSFSYEIVFDSNIDLDEAVVPPMIIQPFVENAIWHGLMPKQGSKKVSIEFKPLTDTVLSCTITDNGIGREAAAAIKQIKGDTKHKSKGLSLAYERLRILESQFNQPFNISIDDIKNDDGTAGGTKISLTLFTGG